MSPAGTVPPAAEPVAPDPAAARSGPPASGGRSRPGTRVDVSIISCAHDLADARLHRTAAAMVRRGLSVEVIGLGDPAAAPPDTRVTSLGTRRGPRARAGTALTLPFRAAGRVVVTLDPDLIPAATLARLLPGRPRVLVVDVHEDYVKLLDDRALGRSRLGHAARAAVRGCTALARRADLTVVADEHVPPARARRRLVVRNLPDPGYLPEPVEPAAVPRALYIGDVRRSRGLQAMVEAVAATPAWELDVVGPVHPADADWVTGWQASAPAAARVRFHGRMPPREAWRLAAGAWAGLALLEDTPAFRDAVPTKLYEYFGAGLPVVVTPLPRMAAMVGDAHAGALVRDAAEAAATLARWSADRGEHRRLRAAALRWAEVNLRGESPSENFARTVAELLAGVA